MRINLREPKHSDISQITSWENDPELYDELFYDGPYSREDIADLLHSLNEIGSDQKRYMISTGERLIGIVDLCDIDAQKKEAFVTVMIASPQDRRKGYATMALILLEDIAKTTGVEKLFAWVRTENEASRNLFNSIGYEKSSAGKQLIVNGVPYIHTILFEKCLKESY